MPRDVLQQLIGAAAVTLLGLCACVDEPAPTVKSSKVVLPILTGSERRSARRHVAARPGAATVPHTLFKGSMEAAWVQQQLSNPTLKILDLRSARQFRRGHLPGAINDPQGRALLARVLARRRLPVQSRPLSRLGFPATTTVVLVHRGPDLADQAVAARAYLALYAAGASPERLSILRGGYAAWRQQRRPRSTAPAPRARPRPKSYPADRPTPPETVTGTTPNPALLDRLRRQRQVLLTDSVALATARKRPHTVVVQTAWSPPPQDPGRPPGKGLRFGLAALEIAPGARLHTNAELEQHLGPLLTLREKVRLISLSAEGLWASLLWFTLKTRLGRPDTLNAVYLGEMVPR